MGQCSQSVKSPLLLLLTAGLAFGQADTSFLPQDYRCGISIRYSGTSGVDYLAEPHYYEPLHENRQTVYLKGATSITLFHNALNSLSKAPSAAGLLPDGRPYSATNLVITGAAGPDRILGNGDDGTIRYQFDGDGGSFNVFAPDTDETILRLLPAYTDPFTLASRTYNFNTVPVVGTTGNNGVAVTDRVMHYQYGLLDSAGDEWHSFIIGDDDSYYSYFQDPLRHYKEDVFASDGKLQMLVVNPKAPCVTVAKTGNAQFYTTPAKVYWIPKIHDQTTYIQPGTGTVSITLKDINGNVVYYRLNGGSWINNGTSTVTLADSAFSSGSTLLETYYAGKPTNIRKRTIVKNPAFPSAAETHGHLMWGNQTNLDKIIARRASGPYAYFWNNTMLKRSGAKQQMYDDYGERGFRRWVKGEMITTPEVLINAFVALVLGNDAVATGSTQSYAEYGKKMLLESVISLDPIHSELDSNDFPGPYGEFKGPGYNLMPTMYDYISGYDLLIAHYRSDQHANGITPIQDLFIRDQMGKVCIRAMAYMRGKAAPELWSFPYQTAAWMAGVCMKTYDSPVYGTSGYDGVHTTASPYTPYPTLPETWKHAITDLAAPAGAFPNRAWVYVPTSNETGLMSHNATSYGYWAGDNIGYYQLSRKSYEVISNLSKLHGIAPPEWGAIDQSWIYGAQGTFRNFLGRGTNATTGYTVTLTADDPFVPTTKAIRDALQDDQTVFGPGIQPLTTIKRSSSTAIPLGFTMSRPPTASGTIQMKAMWYFTHEAAMNDWHPDFASIGRQGMLDWGEIPDLSNIRKWLWYDDGGIPSVATVVNPSFSPIPGTYNSTQTVALSTGTSGATIRYTIDGTTPTTSTGSVYSVPLSVPATTTIKAIAYKAGSVNSSVVTGKFTISDIIIAPPTDPGIPSIRVQGGDRVGRSALRR